MMQNLDLFGRAPIKQGQIGQWVRATLWISHETSVELRWCGYRRSTERFWLGDFSRTGSRFRRKRRDVQPTRIGSRIPAPLTIVYAAECWPLNADHLQAKNLPDLHNFIHFALNLGTICAKSFTFHRAFGSGQT